MKWFKKHVWVTTILFFTVMLGIAWAADTELSSITNLGAAPQATDEVYLNDAAVSKALTIANLFLYLGAAYDTEAELLALFAGKQPLDADLTSLALLGTAADKIAYTTAANVWAEYALTATGRSIIDDATVGDVRTTLEIYSSAETDAAIAAADIALDYTGGDIASGVYNTMQIAESGVNHDALANFVAGEHVAWGTASQGTIDNTNITMAASDLSDGANIAHINANESISGYYDYSVDIIMSERADHGSTPGAGKGYLWTKNTEPTTIIFTNDDGTDFTLGEGGSANISDTAYNEGTWDADTTDGASKNALRDYFLLFDTDGDGDVDNIDSALGSGTITTVELEGVVVDATVTVVDFATADFDATESPEDEVLIELDAQVPHLNVADTITANWVNTANPWDITTETNLAVDANEIELTAGSLGLVDHDTARTALGLAIGSDVQAYDVDLDALATPTAWRMFYSDAADTPFIQEITLGADGTFLESNGASAAPDFRALVVGDLTSVTASATELNYTDITTLGTGENSKALTLTAGGNFTAPAGTWDFSSATGLTLQADEIVDADVVDALTVTAQAGSTWNIVDSVTVTSVANSGGTTSLDESTGATDSGAYLIGVADEFDNSNSTNVQAVLNDLDGAIAASATDYEDIGDPGASGSIAMGAYTGTYTTGADLWDGMLITNTQAAITGESELLTLTFTDTESAGSTGDLNYLTMVSNVTTIVEFNEDGLVIGTGTPTNAMDGGDVYITDDVEIDGTLTVTAMELAPSTAPVWTWQDSDASTNKDMMKIHADYDNSVGDEDEIGDWRIVGRNDDGVDNNNSSLQANIMWDGSTQSLAMGVLSNDYAASDVAGYESLLWDFNYGEPSIAVTSPSGATSLDFQIATVEVDALTASDLVTAGAGIALTGEMTVTDPGGILLSDDNYLELDATADGMDDDEYNGIVIGGRNCGEGLTLHDLVYIHASDADMWHKADATVSSGEFPAVGIAIAACTDTNEARILVQGIIRNEGWTGLTPGQFVYLDEVDGGLIVDEVVPSTSGDAIQIVGRAISDSEIYFNFDNVWTEVE